MHFSMKTMCTSVNKVRTLIKGQFYLEKEDYELGHWDAQVFCATEAS